MGHKFLAVFIFIGFLSGFTRLFTHPVNCLATYGSHVVADTVDFGRCVLGNATATLDGAADSADAALPFA